MNAQEEIRSAIKSCAAPVLNQHLLWKPRHASILTSFEDISSTTRLTTQFYDVPLTSIVMLGRDGPDRVYEELFGRWPDGSPRVNPLTWRLLMNQWLRDDRWGQAALDMITSPFGRRSFPVPGSHDYLSLISYGGALSCYVGNHRIVAAVCWAAAQGMSHLKEVEVSVRPVLSMAISELISKFE